MPVYQVSYIVRNANIGFTELVNVIEPGELGGEQAQVNVVTVDTEGDQHHGKHALKVQLQDIPTEERTRLIAVLEKYNHVFSLEEGERGETDWTEMHIDTGDASPKKQPVRRVPFAVHQEVAMQLAGMQEEGSSSLQVVPGLVPLC